MFIQKNVNFPLFLEITPGYAQEISLKATTGWNGGAGALSDPTWATQFATAPTTP